MGQVNVSQQNWAGGELSPKLRGRFDLPLYATGAERLINFISEAQGAAKFRPGSQYVINTRRNNRAVLIPFQFNDSQSYLLEFTEGYIRFLRNNGILVTGDKTITGATKANPCVITAVGHGYSTGDEVIISGVGGMVELNNRSFVIIVLSADTFSLQDQFGNDINSSAYTTYTSGGISQKILEITSPYQEEHLYQLKTGQNADTMYIVHPYYEPRKLTRSSATSWSLSLFSRTSDPFTSKKTISGVTQANPAEVTAVGHGYSTGQQIIIEAIVGMTQLNGRYFQITVTGADTFTLQDFDGNNIDSTGYTAYSSAGYASSKRLLPGAFCFYQGRALYGYSDDFPQSFWGSKALDSNGNPQYDVMTTGTSAADGFKFTLSPSTGKVDKIQSLIPTVNFLAIATFESIFKADGGTNGAAITPSNINVVPAVTQGVLREITPILLGLNLIFIHRSGRILYSLEYDIFYSAYTGLDKSIQNEQLTESGFIQMVYCNTRPPLFWAVRNDGLLVGITFMLKENINGGHRHEFGGEDALVLSVGNMPRDGQYDQTWVVVERTIDGHTCRYNEYLNDEVLIPELSDYYTSDDDELNDEDTWRNAMFEAQKTYIHLDAAATYDGSVFGTDANATMTPGALTGTGVTFTASASVFTSDMVGREIWKRSLNGIGTGRAQITAYVSATQVTCTILSDFDTTTAMAAGNWFLTADDIGGLWHLEGEDVGVVTDGGEHADGTVDNGMITLQYQASIVHVGKKYSGLIKSMAIEGGGVNGPANVKYKTINNIGLKFLNTLGARYGSNLYRMEEVFFRSPNDYTGRPAPLFTGVKKLPFEDDNTEIDKHIYIQQTKPLPCIVLAAVPSMDTDNE